MPVQSLWAYACVIVKVKGKEVKIFLLQAVEAHRVPRG
jgi:hypothetical protein